MFMLTAETINSVTNNFIVDLFFHFGMKNVRKFSALYVRDVEAFEWLLYHVYLSVFLPLFLVYVLVIYFFYTVK